MDSQGIAHQYHLRADARGYAIDIALDGGARHPFMVTCCDPHDRADPRTNAQRGQLAAQTMGFPLSEVKVDEDLGVRLTAEELRR